MRVRVVRTIAPVRGPAILHNPVVLTVLRAIPNSQNRVIQVVDSVHARRLVLHAGRIETQRIVTGVDRDRDRAFRRERVHQSVFIARSDVHEAGDRRTGLGAIGVAFTDVVVDALMVTKGQPHGLTGRFQSVQWGALYGATIITASAGGYLSAQGRQDVAFLICGLLTVGTLVLSAVAVREPRAEGLRHDFAPTLGLLRRAAASRTILAVGLFMFCWN